MKKNYQMPTTESCELDSEMLMAGSDSDDYIPSGSVPGGEGENNPFGVKQNLGGMFESFGIGDTDFYDLM